MSIPQLRVASYLCPTVHVELFQRVLEILEKETGYHTILQYEWRSNGFSDTRIDLFESNLVDIAFMPAAGYIPWREKKNVYAELLPLTPIFKHPKNDQSIPATYIDIIIHSDKLTHGVNEILDLRGCRWACVDEASVANGITLSELRKLGENVTFFGSVHRTTSHLSAVNMVLTKQVDAASVDSTALTCNKRYLHNGGKDVVVLTSFGPFAPYAILINSRINPQLKQKIISVLENINGNDMYFDKFGLIKFVPNLPSVYDKENNFVKSLKGSMSKVPYY